MSRNAEEAGLGEAGERQPPKLTLSSTYNAADADVELRSKDGVRFLVHRANLLASSTMLAGMFELVPAPDAKVPIVPLEESGALLEQMLAYFYPKKIPRLELGEMEDDVALIGAFDKYEVWRGLEAYSSAFAAAFHLYQGSDFFDFPRELWPGLQTAAFAYAFAKAFHYDDLRDNAKLALLETAEHEGDLEDRLARIDLGSLGASLDCAMLALRLLTHVHDARKLQAASRIEFSRKSRQHAHHRRTQLASDIWDHLNYFTGPGLGSRYDKLAPVLSSAQDCADCLLALQSEVRELEARLLLLAERHDGKW